VVAGAEEATEEVVDGLATAAHQRKTGVSREVEELPQAYCRRILLQLQQIEEFN
jgi:hypothetical protein